MTYTLTIESKPTADGKTRRFSATLLGYIRADRLWEGGKTDTKAIRPVALWVAGTEAALRPFLANLKTGRKATMENPQSYYNRSAGQIEILRSAGYDVTWQKLTGGTAVVTLYLHELFAADPGLIDSASCAFISAPDSGWVGEQVAMLNGRPDLWQPVLIHAERLGLLTNARSPIGVPVALSEDELKLVTVLAYHFCGSLDRRTRRPLINSLAFYMQLYLSLLGVHGASYHKDHPWVWARGHKTFVAEGVDRLGAVNPIMMQAGQDDLDDFLAEQTTIYRNYGGNHGPS